jgi:hypothetical protein
MSMLIIDSGASVTHVTPTIALRLTLKQAVNSPFEWDFGAKQVFDWVVQREYSDGKSRVGCYSANRWYEVETGRSEKETLRNAKFLLRAKTTVPIQSFEYVKYEG